ncbi:hypothetical protein DL93DRAFT_438283 [Clavulina sp. PMI_390]|nr:hypothetical protein DL93DRAFT_438283 [Clavulina sp. PMI_390]
MAHLDSDIMESMRASICALSENLSDPSLSLPSITPVILLHPPSQRPAHASIIQEKIESLEAWYDDIESLIEKLQGLQDSLRQQYTMYASAFAPITALPTEVLANIFHGVKSSDQGAAYNLCQVCAHWKGVIAGDPTMHLSSTTGVRLDGNIESAVSAFQAAPSLPLNLNVIENHEDWPSRLEKAVPKFHERLQSLQWSSTAHIDRFLVNPFIKKRNFRMLESIKIEKPPRPLGTLYIPEPESEVQISQGRDKSQGLATNTFPVLKKLGIRETPLVIPPQIIRQLEHLSYADGEVGSDRCTSWVAHADSMRTLAIENLEEPSRPFRYNSSPIRTLPILRALILHRPHQELLHMFFRTCHCPLLESLEINTFRENWNGDYAEASRFFKQAPNLRDLVLLRTQSETITTITAPLSSRASQLRRLTFLTEGDRTEWTVQWLVDKIAGIANARSKVEGFSSFVVQTRIDLVPALQSSLPEAYLVLEIVGNPSLRGDVDIFP